MNKIITFMLGVAAGSAGTYFAVKKAIEIRTDKEIESVVTTFKERFDKMEEILTDEQKEELGIYSPSKEAVNEPVTILQKRPYPEEEKNETQKNYEKEVEKLGYSVGVDLSEGQDQNAESIVKVDNGPVGSAPYIISEDEFGEFGNEEETLILYADKVLATEDDEIVDDPEALLGDCLSEFDEYVESMYVRNQNRETDYIILRSEKNFGDINPEVIE